MKTTKQLIEQLVQTRLDEALGNLNKLPKGYKILVQYALKRLDFFPIILYQPQLGAAQKQNANHSTHKYVQMVL